MMTNFILTLMELMSRMPISKKKSMYLTTVGVFVIDTLAYSVSGLPARFSAHKKGDTSESQLISLVISQINPAAGANQRDALQGLSIAVCAKLRIDEST
jgi:hypothetical protein